MSTVHGASFSSIVPFYEQFSIPWQLLPKKCHHFKDTNTLWSTKTYYASHYHSSIFTLAIFLEVTMLSSSARSSLNFFWFGSYCPLIIHSSNFFKLLLQLFLNVCLLFLKKSELGYSRNVGLIVHQPIACVLCCNTNK